MPDAAEFLLGFGFIQGNIFGGYVLSQTYSTHETIKRYKEYLYHIKIDFVNSGLGNYNDLFQLVYEKISQQPVIYGIRNPYRCMIDTPKYGDIIESDNGIITFNLIGHSYRI